MEVLGRSNLNISANVTQPKLVLNWAVYKSNCPKIILYFAVIVFFSRALAA